MALGSVSGLAQRPFTGIPVAVGSTEQVIKSILRLARNPSERGCDVHLLEMNGIAMADRSPSFENLLVTAGLVIPDGRWLQVFTQRSEVPLFQTRGEDLFRGVLSGDGGEPLASYFVGSSPEVLERLRSKVLRDFSGTVIVGMESPPFRDLTDVEIVEIASRIKVSGSQIVWVGISTPRQDYLARRLSELTGAVVVAVGAAFDFVSGFKSSAPRWLRRAGLEWVYRLFSEPRRLWRRYLFGSFTFLGRVFRFRHELITSNE